MGSLSAAARTLYHRFRRRRRGEPRPLEDRGKQHLRAVAAEGISVIENYYTREQCNALIAEMERLFKEYDQFIERDACNSDNRAYAANRASAAIAKYFSDSFITDLSKAYMGPQEQCFFTLANKVVPFPGNLGSGGGWHRDTPHEHQFKSILYLTDVTAETGAFEYIPRSHKVSYFVKAIRSAGIKFAQNRLSDEDIQRLVTSLGVEPRVMSASAGTLILVDSSGVHRGRPIMSGVRYALTNYFFSASAIETHKKQNKFVKYFLPSNSDGQKANPVGGAA